MQMQLITEQISVQTLRIVDEEESTLAWSWVSSLVPSDIITLCTTL